MLRIEFEQNLAANEQTGPINKEMRNLITSLQTHNVQLKGEVARYKRKCKESAAESAQLRKKLDDMQTAEIKALQVSWTFWTFDQIVPMTHSHTGTPS